MLVALVFLVDWLLLQGRITHGLMEEGAFVMSHDLRGVLHHILIEPFFRR